MRDAKDILSEVANLLGKGRGHMVAAEKLHLLPAEEQEMIEEYLGKRSDAIHGGVQLLPGD